MIVEPPRHPVQRVLFLKRIPWLARVHAADLALLGDGAEERAFRRGEALLRGGEPVPAMLLVVDGRVRLARRGRALGAAEPGSVVGARLLLADDADGLDAVAEGDGLALALGREAFLDALEERFPLYLGVLRETCRELVDLFERAPGEAAPAGSEPPRAAPPEGGLDLVERLVLLRSRPPFGAYGIDALAELSQRLVEVRIPAGRALWRRGDRSGRLLFVARGAVRCAPAAREAAFVLGAGQPVGTMESLAERPRWFDAVAEEPVTALEGDAEHLVDVLEDNADMALAFLAHLARVSVGVQERLAAREGALPRLFGCEGACG